MITLQEWLDKKYSTKKEVREIFFNPDNAKEEMKPFKEIDGGELNLSEYPNLERINVYGTWLKSPLTKMKVSNCPNLKMFGCFNNGSSLTDLRIINCPQLSWIGRGCNGLSSLDFLDALDPKKVTMLDLGINNFSTQDLSCFSKFVNLTYLRISNNHFAGFN